MAHTKKGDVTLTRQACPLHTKDSTKVFIHACIQIADELDVLLVLLEYVHSDYIRV
jgi:hypothetical protein